jgi:hypothetical protein
MIKNQNISLSDCFVQGKENIVSDMGGEKVMLSIHNGKYYNLGEVGGRIWDLLVLPVTAQQIVHTLMIEYKVEQSECEQRVVSFLEHLFDEEIIQFNG